MERRITEEKATKAILDWLEENGWQIICYDFPQSGTGVSLHPNRELRTTKNKGAFIPDIIAVKNNIVVFFENKDRFMLDDFIKVNELRNNCDYLNSIEKLLADFHPINIFYGVGLVHSVTTEKKTNENLNKVDFVIFYVNDKLLKIHFDPNRLF